MFEKVNPAHPDKIADRIAGALVDMAYEKVRDPKIAVEVLIGHGVCHIIAETSVHLSVEESTGGDDYALRTKFCVEKCFNTLYLRVFHDYLLHLVLPDVEVVGVLKNVAPCGDKLGTVALRSWAPHSRSF